jgi:hypothetical protein
MKEWHKYISSLSLLGTFILAVIIFTRFLGGMQTNQVVLTGDMDKNVAILSLQVENLKQRANIHESDCKEERRHIRSELAELRELLQEVLLRMPSPKPKVDFEISATIESHPRRVFYFEQRRWSREGTTYH